MKLTKVFVVYRNWDAKIIRHRIGELMRTVEMAAKLEGETILWTDYREDCVFMCGGDGDLTAGDRIQSRSIPAVIRKWAESFIAMIQFAPSDCGGGCAPEDVGTDVDFGNTRCEIEISSPEGAYGLRIRCIGEDGGVISEIAFAPAVGTSEATFSMPKREKGDLK